MIDKSGHAYHFYIKYLGNRAAIFTTKIVATSCLVNQLCCSRLFMTTQFIYKTQSDIHDTIRQAISMTLNDASRKLKIGCDWSVKVAAICGLTSRVVTFTSRLGLLNPNWTMNSQIGVSDFCSSWSLKLK